MKQLWAPWRVEYIYCVNERRGRKGCLFCSLKRAANDADNLILFRGDRCFVVMNRFPYNSGHLMVAPYRHVASLTGLRDEEGQELIALLRQGLRVLQREFKPQGFNVGANLGAVAGAGVAGHLHFHVVPRWQGDTNFMPVLAETKVVSEHLQETYRRLQRRFNRG